MPPPFTVHAGDDPGRDLGEWDHSGSIRIPGNLVVGGTVVAGQFADSEDNVSAQIDAIDDRVSALEAFNSGTPGLVYQYGTAPPAYAADTGNPLFVATDTGELWIPIAGTWYTSSLTAQTLVDGGANAPTNFTAVVNPDNTVSCAWTLPTAPAGYSISAVTVREKFKSPAGVSGMPLAGSATNNTRPSSSTASTREYYVTCTFSKAANPDVESAESNHVTVTLPYSGSSGQTLGVGGIAAPAAASNVTLVGSDSGSTLTITDDGVIYDGGGHSVPKIVITADNVTVQNFVIHGGSNSGVNSTGTGNTIQNCDIYGITSDGDCNGITFFGDNTTIAYNTIGRTADLLSGAANGSHTDGIQTWNTPSKQSSSNVIIKGNYITGPTSTGNAAYIHQGITVEGANATSGGGGGTGVTQNWTVTGNTFITAGNQVLELRDIHNVTISGNTFAGNATHIVDSADGSTAINYYSDNVRSGTYTDVGVAVISGSPGSTQTPAGILGIGTSNFFNLTQDQSTGVELTPTCAQLAAGYVSDPYFYVNATNDAVAMSTTANATTTQNSPHPRTELREVKPDGTTKAAWTAQSGATHVMFGTSTITHLPADNESSSTPKPQVCFAQIHDAVGDVVRLQVENAGSTPSDSPGGTSVSHLHLVAHTHSPNGSASTEVKTSIQSSYTLGDAINWKIEVTGTTCNIYIGGTITGTVGNYTWTGGTVKKSFSISGTGFYFKAGDYQQFSTVAGDGQYAATSYAITELKNLSVAHSSYA